MTEPSLRFIAAPAELGGAPLFRRQVFLDQPRELLVKASITLSAIGVVEGWIDSRPISADLLVPGWSSFEWRLRCVNYDVIDHIHSSRFTMAFIVGEGWYTGRLGWHPGTPRYGTRRALYVHLHLTFADGHEQTVTSTNDGAWRAGPSGVTRDSIYDGQSIDARVTSSVWDESGSVGARWGAVEEFGIDLPLLDEMIAPPVRRVEEMRPQRVWQSPSGNTLVDFGVNLVGFCRVRVIGPRGSTIAVRHAEVLEDGELAIRPLRTALATDEFTLSGANDVFEPTLTFHGFRYVEVSGWPGGREEINDGSLVAVAISSDLRRTGWFESSNQLLNALHDNVVRSMRGNFLDVPTDCPQRDERLGWTGDIAVFAPTAVFVADAKSFLSDWLRDLACEQKHSGFVPLVVPDVLKYMPAHPFPGARTVAFWSDAAVWVPWAMWNAYGDHDALSESYPSMLSHIEQIAMDIGVDGVSDSGVQLGDWLDPDADPHRPGDAKADKAVVATAAAYRSVRIVSAVAMLLERDEAERLEVLARRIKAGFAERFVHDQRITSDCTTVYSLAIAFDLLSAHEKVWAGDRLAELVRADGFHISTGFAGTPFILDALSHTGHLSEAYALLEQTECPSWLYPVTMGATTVWERWDSLLPDGTLNPGEMTSFNHYALGAVADWMHRVIGGIAPLAPGYSAVRIEPRPRGTVTSARTRLLTVHGEIAVNWSLSAHTLELAVSLPPGVHAIVTLPDGSDHRVRGGSHHFTSEIPEAAVRTTLPL